MYIHEQHDNNLYFLLALWLVLLTLMHAYMILITENQFKTAHDN